MDSKEMLKNSLEFILRETSETGMSFSSLIDNDFKRIDNYPKWVIYEDGTYKTNSEVYARIGRIGANSWQREIFEEDKKIRYLNKWGVLSYDPKTENFIFLDKIIPKKDLSSYCQIGDCLLFNLGDGLLIEMEHLYNLPSVKWTKKGAGLWETSESVVIEHKTGGEVAKGAFVHPERGVHDKKILKVQYRNKEYEGEDGAVIAGKRFKTDLINEGKYAPFLVLKRKYKKYHSFYGKIKDHEEIILLKGVDMLPGE